MQNAEEYEETYKALLVCVQERIPVILWGPPGQGKTSVIKALAKDTGRHLEVLLASIREPQDFAGLPFIHEGQARLVPPDWAQRLAQTKDGILFTDEVNTAPPSVQAALLRVSLDKVAGDTHLGDDTSVIAAANPPEQAADGWDLAPPLANRFVHLEWSLPADIVQNGLAGSWPSFQTKAPDAKELAETKKLEAIQVAGFLTSRPDLTTRLPDTSAEQGRAYPTPRSWEMAAILSAYVTAAKLSEGVRRLLVRGCIGQGAAAEYLTYRSNLDLPNPSDVLKAPNKFVVPKRADQVYVIGAGVVAVARSRGDGPTWQAAGQVLERISVAGKSDIAVSLAREWMKCRPGNETPSESTLKSLIPLMKEARLI